MTIVRLASIATIFLLTSVPALAATPPPAAKATAHVALPNEPLHAQYDVEVNKKGQVVAVKSARPSKVGSFNTQTYGNALQMWIRHPDGTATVGLYRVTYDYDPKTRKVGRQIALLSTGGSWGDKEGAATLMMETAQREAEAAIKQREEQAKKLPSLDQITGKSPAPSPTPHR